MYVCGVYYSGVVFVCCVFCLCRLGSASYSVVFYILFSFRFIVFSLLIVVWCSMFVSMFLRSVCVCRIVFCLVLLSFYTGILFRFLLVMFVPVLVFFGCGVVCQYIYLRISWDISHFRHVLLKRIFALQCSNCIPQFTYV
jgi:hypothetical protein